MVYILLIQAIVDVEKNTLFLNTLAIN